MFWDFMCWLFTRHKIQIYDVTYPGLRTCRCGKAVT